MADLELEKLSIDVAAQELIKKAQAEGVETIFDRAKTMKPCPIGAEGACCRICAQGPCRVPPPKKKEGESGEEKKQRMGLCGATAETIVARNFARMVAVRHLGPQRPLPGGPPCCLRRSPTARPRL